MCVLEIAPELMCMNIGGLSDAWQGLRNFLIGSKLRALDSFIHQQEGLQKQ
jgi:hypothetical protein